jgi:hypothetical protein
MQIPHGHRQHVAVVARKRLIHRLPGVQVPDPHGVVIAAGHRDRPATQLADSHRHDLAAVALQRRAQRSSRLQVPHPRRAVVAARDRDRAAMQLPDRDRVDLALVAFQRLIDQPSGVQVPHPHRAVVAAGDHDRPGGGRAHRHRCGPRRHAAAVEGSGRVARYRARHRPCALLGPHAEPTTVSARLLAGTRPEAGTVYTNGPQSLLTPSRTRWAGVPEC